MKKINCPNLAKNLLVLLILSLVFAVLFSGSIYALSSDNINLQGKIVRNDIGHEGLNVIPGSPACVVNGPSNDTCDFRVSYYTALTGGTLLLTEDFTNVEIGQFDGVFELSLGSGTVTTTLQCRDGTCNSPSEVISEYGDLYVELQFAPDGSTLTETFTRMPLEASPYAIFSKFAEGAHDAFKLSTSVSNESLENPSAGMIYFDTGSSQLKVYNGAEWQGLSAGTSSSLWTDAGTYSYLTSTTDDLVLGGSTFNTGRFVFDMDGGSGSYFDVFNNDHSNKLFTILSNGNIGIGTATPGAKLEVGGTASTITNSTGNLTISTGGGNGNILLMPNGTGKVGIGTTIPAAKLDVVPATSSDVVFRTKSLQSTAPLGSELVGNGNFTTNPDTSWSWGTGWTQDTTNLEADHATGNVASLTQSINVTNGTTYQVEITVKNRTTGSVTLDINGVYIYNYGSTTALDANTTYKRSLVANITGAATLSITPTTDFNGSVDNITVKPITGISQPNFALLDDAGLVMAELRGKNSLSNLALGTNALRYNTTGNNNSAIGTNALYSNTTGYFNSAMGMQALYSNTTGNYNSAMGVNALYANTTGVNNSAMGMQALTFNTTGNNNSAVGMQALFFNTTGSSNNALGVQALYSNTTGSSNSAVGYKTLFNNTTGYSNSAMGTNALYSNTTGYFNSAMGTYAGRYISGGGANQTSSNSLYLGYDTRALADGDTNEIVIGASTVGFGSNSAAYGNASMTKHIFQAGNVGIGTTSPSSKLVVNTGGYSTIKLQYNGTPVVDIFSNVSSNIFIGLDSGSAITSGTGNVALGDNALSATTIGTSNTAIGSYAGNAITTGSNNSLFGYSAGSNLTTGSNNIIIGANINADSATASYQLNIGGAIKGDLSTGDVNITRNLGINGVAYTWPGSTNPYPSATISILNNNGSGGLSWSTFADLGLVSGTGSAGQISYWNGTNSITGSNSFWWDSTNNRLGIGTNNPQASIDIAGSTSVISNVSGNITITPASNLIVSQGNVGIGATAPGYKLDVSGDIRASGTVLWGNYASRTETKNDAGTIASKSGFFETYAPVNYYSGASGWQHLIEARHSNDGNNYALQIAGSFFDQDLYFRKTNNSASTAWAKVVNVNSSGNVLLPGSGIWNSSGNVGIGTTQPNAKFQISGSSITTSNDTVLQNLQILQLPGTSGNRNSVSAGFSINSFEGNNINGRGSLHIMVSGSPGSGNVWGSIPDIDVMTLNGNGNVGIGTASPAAKLTVNSYLAGTAASKVFQINAGSLGTTAGDTLKLASLGFNSSNASSLGIEALRVSDGTSWHTTAINLKMDVDNTSPVNNAIISLNANGNVGIGTTTPAAKLEVDGTIGAYSDSDSWILLYPGGDTTSIIWDSATSPGGGLNFSTWDTFTGGNYSIKMTVTNAGNVGIGTADPTYRLQLPNTADNAGKGQANAWVTYSDKSLKENIQNITGGLDKIMALRGVTFDWKGQGVASSGFIAQEVELVIPDLVSTDINGIKSLDYGRFTPYLVEAIKEQQLQIQTAYNRIEQLENINESKIINITTPGWYRISKLDINDDHSNIKINNTSIGASQNIVLSIDSTLNNQNINIVSNLTTGGYDITKARINNENGIKYLEIYIPEVNENKISVKITESSNWITTDIVQITEEVNNTQEYALNGILFGISDKLEVEEDNVKIAGDLLSLSVNSSIGDSANRWNDIYAKGTIRLGSGADGEGAIRFNVQTKTLEFSNNGVEWLSVGDLSSQMTISPEYAGAILFADGSDNSGIMTSDAVEEGGSFKNYYEWVSNKDTPQDYDILVRITLPADFLSWKEDAIYLDFMTENSVNTDNNSVGLSLIGSSGVDAQISGGISKIAGAWERMSIKGVDITQCNSAGGTCTLRISLTSSMEYFTRVGDITLNYNRSL